MALMDQLGGLLNQYAGGAAVSREQAGSDYDKIKNTVPSDVLGSIIGPAIGSLGGAEVVERIRNSAGQMSPGLRGDLLQQLLNAAGGAGGNVGSILSQLGIDRSVATQPDKATPDDVAKVAGHVHAAHPDAFNRAMSFFTDHPTLVKVLGTAVIAKIAQHLTRTPQPGR